MNLGDLVRFWGTIIGIGLIILGLRWAGLFQPTHSTVTLIVIYAACETIVSALRSPTSTGEVNPIPDAGTVGDTGEAG